MQFSVTEYLESLLQKLLNSSQHKVELTRDWVNHFPNKPGVYIFWSGETIIYVGESGSIRGRMKDMIDTRNHTFRRTIGSDLYCDRSNYTKASASLRFCDEIEKELNLYISSNTTLSFLPVELGRKELEERIFLGYAPKYNNKGKRKTF